ncbi:hypothetical protein [uncultured Lutibacter sp.]|uniref:hypothetical protein n=1 Tax=uncultured Lutibacter sp. TaxID=437739 RepID=UPI0026158D3F|nr:hypothetical protein [uncultured Lutibacter sp.]
MGKKIAIVMVLLLMINSLHSQQNKNSYKTIDSLTYDLFLKQEWKNLLKVGNDFKKNETDFYYLKIRMGIANFKLGKYLLAVKLLEEAYNLNNFNVVVQDYLYWAYRYSGLYLESDMFYKKMDATLQKQIGLDLKFISAVDVGVVATSNPDYDNLLLGNTASETINTRNFIDNHQIITVGLNHRFSNNSNFYHRLTVMPRKLVYQENNSGATTNIFYEGTEIRYYADATFSLGKRWYLDAYAVLLFGEYDDLSSLSTENSINSNNKINYSDVVFGGAISKSSIYFRNSFNISYSNLNGANQLQTGYSISMYPLGNNLVVPFGSFQYLSESLDSNSENRFIYSGGVAVNKNKMSLTGFATIGEIKNYISSNGLVVYNQLAETESEFGAILQVYLNKFQLKLGYSLMNMKDYSISDIEIQNSFKYKQQNLILGVTWTQ